MRNSSRWFRNLEEDGLVEEEDGNVAFVVFKKPMQRTKNQTRMMKFRTNSFLDVDIMISVWVFRKWCGT